MTKFISNTSIITLAISRPCTISVVTTPYPNRTGIVQSFDMRGWGQGHHMDGTLKEEDLCKILCFGNITNLIGT